MYFVESFLRSYLRRGGGLKKLYIIISRRTSARSTFLCHRRRRRSANNMNMNTNNKNMCTLCKTRSRTYNDVWNIPI